MSSARSHDINNDDISAKSGEDMYEVIDLRPTAPPLELSNSFTSLASHLTVDSGLREVLQMSITDDLEGIQRNDLPSHWDVLPPSHWNLAGSEKSPLKNLTDSVEMTRGTMTRRDSMRRDTACSTDGHSDAWSGASSDHSGSSSKSGSSSSSTDTVFDKKWKRKLYIGLVFKSTAIFAVVMLATSAVLFILSDQVQESILSSMAHSKFFVNLFGLADGVEMRQSGRMMVQFPESKRDVISISWVDHCRQAGILKH